MAAQAGLGDLRPGRKRLLQGLVLGMVGRDPALGSLGCLLGHSPPGSLIAFGRARAGT
jgi:hypothetical protein